MHKLFLAGSMIACLILGLNASAQKNVYIPSDRKRKAIDKDPARKYFIRFESGAAYARTSIVSFDLEGGMIPADIYVGIGVMKNTYIHAAIGTNIFTDKFNTLGRHDVYEKSSVFIYDFGGGLTVYAVPEWLYISGSVTGSKTVRYPVPGISRAFGSQTGIGLEIKLGTSVMITRFFGLGISGFIYTSMMKDEEDVNEYTRKIRNNVMGLTFTGIIGKL